MSSDFYNGGKDCKQNNPNLAYGKIKFKYWPS